MSKIKDTTDVKYTLTMDQLPLSQHNSVSTSVYSNPFQFVLTELQKQTKLLEELVWNLCPPKE